MGSIDKEQQEATKIPQPPVTRPHVGSTNKRLSKQLSMKENTREVKWEKRRRQMQRQRSSMGVHDAQHDRCGHADVAAADGEAAASSAERTPKGLTDEDLDELKGSMELGFGFDEENGGQDLCDTLPALDLYFAVNRQLSEPKMRKSTSSLPSLMSPSPSASSSSSTLCGTPPGSPGALSSADSWKIVNPGDNPQLVKTRLRHWAQVVACSVKHSSGGDNRVL